MKTRAWNALHTVIEKAAKRSFEQGYTSPEDLANRITDAVIYAYELTLKKA